MRIIVIGSGLLGVTSAYFLAQNGAEVTVLDRGDAAASATSYANAGMLTPSMADPWNSPGVFGQLLRYLGKEDAPLLLRVRALPSILGWGLAFLANSSVEKFHASMAANLRLANYSRETLRTLREQLALSYDQKTAGTLRVFREQRALDASAARWETLASFGLKTNVLSAAATVTLEPALAEVREQLAGGIHCPQDESGDARKFTETLAEKARKAGVAFKFGTTVTGFKHDGEKITRVVPDTESLVADAVVISAGSWSTPLLQGLGLRLPMRPVKGYSITLDAGAWNQRPGLPVIDDALHAAVTPLGQRLRVAGTAEFAGYDTSLSPARIENLFSLLLNIYPGFAPHLDRAQAQPWAGLRPMSADGVPFIGRLRYQNLYLNTGHGHLGWTLAAGSARLLADLMADKTPEIDPAPYAADRR